MIALQLRAWRSVGPKLSLSPFPRCVAQPQRYHVRTAQLPRGSGCLPLRNGWDPSGYPNTHNFSPTTASTTPAFSRTLTNQHLKDMGVPLGHRRKMLVAIGEAGVAAASASPRFVPATEPKPWQVLGAGHAESRFEALRTATTPLVGRRRGDRPADAPLRAGQAG
jgi:hypothetical protein